MRKNLVSEAQRGLMEKLAQPPRKILPSENHREHKTEMKFAYFLTFMIFLVAIGSCVTTLFRTELTIDYNIECDTGEADFNYNGIFKNTPITNSINGTHYSNEFLPNELNISGLNNFKCKMAGTVKLPSFLLGVVE